VLIASADGASTHFGQPERSIVTMDEKRAHFVELQATAAAQVPLAEEIERRAAAYAVPGRVVTPQSARRAIA
jgi:hypothetical protein